MAKNSGLQLEQQGVQRLIHVSSLKNTIILQFAVILVPLIALLAYQTVSESRRAQEITTYTQLHDQAVQIRDRFNQFTNGVVDAIDTRRISTTALESLRATARGLAQLDPHYTSRNLMAHSAELTKMADALVADSSVRQLEFFRDRISSTRTLVAELQSDSSKNLDAANQRSITESRHNRKIVITAGLALFGLTLWFIYRMIKVLTQPLAVAVDAADSIAAGRQVNIDLSAQRDIGNLLTSIKRMHESLQRSQDGLNQKIKQLADSEASLSEAQRMALLGNWHWELNSALIYWSDEMRRIVEFDQQARPSLRRFIATVPRAQRKDVIDELRSLLTAPRRFSGEHQITRIDDVQRIVTHQGASEADARGRIIRIHGTIQDITERKQAEQKIRRLALYDSLTGLPNRQFFKESLDLAIARAQRGNENLATLFIDLDRFKRVNDTLGHAAGDMLLQEAGRRLRRCVRVSDFVGREAKLPEGVIARLGGDEFTVSLLNLKHPQDAAKVAGRILHEFEKPFLVDGQELNVTASIGIAVFPINGEDAETLIKNADVAMYQAKAAGKNAYKFFTAEMNTAALEKLKLENEIRQALDQEQFVLYYHPKIDLHANRIIGVEALIRWNHPERGLVPPGLFIGIAEEIGMIVPIGQWVLQTACKQLAAWRQMNLPEITLAVNLAGPSFRSAQLATEVEAALRELNLPPRLLELEATESMVMHDIGVTLKTLGHLRELGVKLSIDDFGTGHSSLSYLRRFRIDQLKIDRSFIAEITNNPDAAAITTAIISLGKSLDIEVVAEGVETKAQANLLFAQGCRLLQGYYFGEPVSANAIVQQLLAKGHGLPNDFRTENK